MAVMVGIVISVFGIEAAELTAGSVETVDWLLLANSNYFYAAPTVVLEVKYKPPLVSASSPLQGSADTISGDGEEPAAGQTEDDDILDMAISSDDRQTTTDQQTEGTELPELPEEDGDDSAVSVGHHNALIISRLTEDNSLHTEIEVDNIASNDQIFIDVFSGDVFSPASSGDDQEEISEAADTVFISFENENGTVKSVRIGLDDQDGGGIDRITVLDGISEQQPASQDANHSHHIDDSSFGLEQFHSPIIVIMPPNDERIYFEDGRKLKEQVFSKDYEIGEIRAVQNEVQIRLVEK